MAFCGQCGSELQAGARFCPQCGAYVAEHAHEPWAAADAGVPELPSEGGVVEVPASAKAGRVTLSTWKNVPPTAQERETVPVAGASARSQRARAARQAPERAQSQQAHSTRSASANGAAKSGAHASTGRHASSGGGSRPAAKRKSKLPLLIGVVGAAVVVALFALYVVPLFIWHPVDPYEHEALTSGAAQSASSQASSSDAASTTASSAASSSSAASASSAFPSQAASIASGPAADASSAASSASGPATDTSSAASSASGPATDESSPAASPPTSASYSTFAWPTMDDFQWLTGEAAKGNVPSGAKRVVDFGTLMGGWKAYLFGSGMERFCHADIDAGQTGAQVALDWYQVIDGDTGQIHEDSTPTSWFNGTFDGGMLDATGSGRITLAAFWEQDGHQYAVGSFIWPSGESDTVALVRP